MALFPGKGDFKYNREQAPPLVDDKSTTFSFLSFSLFNSIA
jgi:hypothetical protein